MMPEKIDFLVNGSPTSVVAPPMSRLLDVLREDLKLTGTKEGCGEGECGACAVRVDGRLVCACLVPIVSVRGASVETIEGVSQDGTPSRLQASFLEHGAAQCGICTPGMVMAGETLLSESPAPSEAEVREALSGNLCRCTGYSAIVDAVLAVARKGEAP